MPPMKGFSGSVGADAMAGGAGGGSAKTLYPDQYVWQLCHLRLPGTTSWPCPRFAQQRDAVLPYLLELRSVLNLCRAPWT